MTRSITDHKFTSHEVVSVATELYDSLSRRTAGVTEGETFISIPLKANDGLTVFAKGWACERKADTGKAYCEAVVKTALLYDGKAPLGSYIDSADLRRINKVLGYCAKDAQGTLEA